MNRALYFFVISFFSILSLLAEEGQAFITTSSKKLDQQWVGQKLDIYLELHSPTWFSGTARFDIPEMKDAIIFKIPGSPVLGNLEKNGQNYTKQIHTFAVFTRRPGRVTIPAFNVEYGIARAGEKPERVKLKSKAITIETQIPKELMGKNFIVSENYSLEEHWTKDLKSNKFKVGDSIKRTIKQSTDNTLSMLLIPILIKAPPSFSIYPEKAKLNDAMVRGDFSAERSEAFSYLFKEEGEITFPEIKLYSYNPITNTTQEHILKAFKLKIAPNPLYKKEASNRIPEEDEEWPLWLLIFIPITLILFFHKKLKLQFSRWNEKRKQSEAYTFALLIKSAPKLEPNKLYAEVDLWVKKLGFASFEHLVKNSSSSSLKEQYSLLNQQLFNNSSDLVDRGLFINELRLARKLYLKKIKLLTKQEKAFFGF
jgi:hypothetical protein